MLFAWMVVRLVVALALRKSFIWKGVHLNEHVASYCVSFISGLWDALLASCILRCGLSGLALCCQRFHLGMVCGFYVYAGLLATEYRWVILDICRPNADLRSCVGHYVTSESLACFG